MSNPKRRINLTLKLLTLCAISLLIVIGVQTVLNIISFNQQQDTNTQERLQSLYTNVGVTVAVALLMLFILWVAITVLVVRPVKHFQEIAERWAMGDLMARTRLTTSDEFQQLGAGLNTLAQKLDESVKEMERSVAERTRDMARQTMYLEAASEVSRAATSILDSHVLMQQVVELIRERFGSYYVGLFLVDEAREWANLQAGTGEAGKAMLSRHHRIKVGQGMIGWSISNSQARIAQEATQDIIRLEASELPKTRSEAALPLRSRGRVIGALTVQSVTAGAFDEGTVTILQTMADQVAIALDNARLFAESTEALETARRAYGELSRAAWVELLRTQPAIGYRCDSQGVTPISATSEGGTAEVENEQTMTLPIKVRGQVLGNIKAHKPQEAGRWTAEETDMMNTMADQLSVALDNARLYRDTQRSAEREHITSEITAKVRASTNINVILRTAVQELADALHIPKASVQLRGGDGESSQ